MANELPPIGLDEIDTATGQQLNAICTAYRSLQNEIGRLRVSSGIKALEGEQKKLASDKNELAKRAFGRRKGTQIEGNGWLLVRSERSSVSAEKLMEAGVTLDTIEACTVTTASYSVRDRK